MTKLALITDIHFGIRQNSVHHLNNVLEFLDKVYFPKLEEFGIKKVINCGDLFDVRKNTNTAIIKAARERYYRRLESLGISEDLIIGNHDIYMRDSNEINSPTEILQDFIDKGVLNVFTKPTEVGPCLYIPWINKENEAETLAAIKQSAKRYCFGHLELAGFQLYRGKVKEEGTESNLFDKFHLTCSGHFHFRSQQRQIVYLGSPTQQNWQDVGDVRGFHIFDDQTGDLEFIPNPYNLYEVIRYTNEKVSQAQLDAARGRYVRVYYDEVTKQSKLDEFCRAIGEVAIEQRSIRASEQQVELGSLTASDIEVEDSITIIKNATTDDLELQDLMVDMYTRALSVMKNG